MIVGVVTDDEARIGLRVVGSRGQELDVEAIVDTGYTGSLTLPPSLIAALDLSWQGLGRGTLADGSESLFDVYEAQVVWDGRMRGLFVDEADTEPLVGMSLLSGYELRLEVRPSGSVEIRPLHT